MADFRVTLTPIHGESPVGFVQDENGIPAQEYDGDYLLSDGYSWVHPLHVFDADGPTWLDSRGHLIPSIPLNLSGYTPPINPIHVTVNGITVTFNGVPVTHGTP